MVTSKDIAIIRYEEKIASETDATIATLVAFVRKFLKRNGLRQASILLIGAGTGRVELPLIKALEGEIKAVVDYVDPAKSLSELFLKEAKILSVHSCIKNIYIDKWERVSPQHPYDIIVAIHSLYDSPDLLDSVMKIKRATKNPGLAIMLLASADSGLDRIKRVLRPLITDRKRAHHSGEDLALILEGAGWRFERKDMSYALDVTAHMPGCERRDMNIINWFLGAKYCAFNKTKKRIIDTYLKQNTRQNRNRYYLPQKNIVLLLTLSLDTV